MKNRVFVRKTRGSRAVKIFAVVLAAVLIVLGALEGGYLYLHATHKVFTPTYEEENLSAILQKEILSENDYDTLFMQTGLTKIAVDDFIRENNAQGILDAQADFFGNYKTVNHLFAPFTCCHKVSEQITVAPIKKGDIIVSLTTHFSGALLGHATIITDATSCETAVSIGYMTKSFLGELSAATNRESFVLLRCKNQEMASAAADYARENMVNLPYSVSVGLTTKKFPEKPIATQCGHLVWYSYRKQGIDIDSNGGAFVYPKDLLSSGHLEVVQVFGMNPLDFKK